MLPLQGITIIAVESCDAGPCGSMPQADLGADVLKVEGRGVGSDSTRGSGPFLDAEGRNFFYEAFNRNKRSSTLDLNMPAGRIVFEDLVCRADALLAQLGYDEASVQGPRGAGVV